MQPSHPVPLSLQATAVQISSGTRPAAHYGGPISAGHAGARGRLGPMDETESERRENGAAS